MASSCCRSPCGNMPRSGGARRAPVDTAVQIDEPVDEVVRRRRPRDVLLEHRREARVDDRLEPLHRFRAIGEADRLLPEEPAEALRVPRLEEEAVELDAVEVAHVRRGERAPDAAPRSGRATPRTATCRRAARPTSPEGMLVGNRPRSSPGSGTPPATRDRSTGSGRRSRRPRHEPLEERHRVVRLRERRASGRAPSASAPRSLPERDASIGSSPALPRLRTTPSAVIPSPEHDGWNTPGNAFEVGGGVGHRKRGSGPMFRGARLGRRRILGTRRLGQSNERSSSVRLFLPSMGGQISVAATR